MTSSDRPSSSSRPQSSSRRHRAGPARRPPTAPSGTVAADAADDADGTDEPQAPVGPPGAIEAAGLTKEYGDAAALQPIDLRIESGQRVSLIGHNGSGKTTLIRMLVGMLEPSAGTARVAGHTAGSIEARAAVSYLADQPVFYDDLSVWEHLEYISRMHGTDDWEQHAVDLVEMVGLTPRIDDLPTTFSRGLKQKAAIAMAFVRPFDVMLIDEPFVGLDRIGRDSLLELIALAHDDGATMVVATHELSSVRVSERLLALRDGSLVYDGHPDDADLAALTEGAPTATE